MKKSKLSSGYLIVDWGTTNFRVFHMDNQNHLINKQELPLGLLQVKNGDFGTALENVLSSWLVSYKKLPIMMAGMVGSLNGWFNVDYVTTNVGVEQLAVKAHQFILPWGAQGTIIPGVSYETTSGNFDVMRGEEVQVFGLSHLMKKPLFNAVLPGTHSKHVRVVNAQITEVSSFMTGELFSVLSKHTILGKGLPKQIDNKDAFIQGVKAGQTDKLTNALFTARTHKLFNKIADTDIHDYLSGLLIGYELKSFNGSHIFLVGSKSLCEKYTIACDVLLIGSTYYSGDDCFLAGMIELTKVIHNA